MPIAKFEEAIKAAKHITDVAPFDGQTYFFAESLQDGKTRVHFFTIKLSVFAQFRNTSIMVIPETLLVLSYLSKVEGNKCVKIHRNSTEILASIQKEGFISLMLKPDSEHIEQIIQHSLINVENSAQTDEFQYFPLLIKQLFRLPLYVYIQALNLMIIKNKMTRLPLKIMGVTTITLFSLYLAFSSIWLYFQNESVKKELTLQRTALNEVFALQTAVDKEKELLGQLANNEKYSIVTANVWPVILELIKTDAEILSLNYFDNQYTVRIKSPRSTDVVQFLSDNEGISTPEVTSAVVKSRGKEIITVKFSLLIKNLNKSLASIALKNSIVSKGIKHELT